MEKKLQKKVEKLVEEISQLLPKAIDCDGDPILVVIDKSCTVEYNESVKSVTFKNSRVNIVIADWLGKERTETFAAREVEYDAVPYLQMIKRAYNREIKKLNN